MSVTYMTLACSCFALPTLASVECLCGSQQRAHRSAVIPCHKHDTQVFDRVRDLRPSGAGVGLQLNGLEALDAIDSKLCQAIFGKTMSIPKFFSHTLDGACSAMFCVQCLQAQHMDTHMHVSYHDVACKPVYDFKQVTCASDLHSLQ